MVRKEIDVKARPSKEQIEELERAAKMPIIYDEYCPELSEKELAEFKRVSSHKEKKI